MYNKSQFFWFFISSSPYTFDVMFSNLYLVSTRNLIVSKICIHYGILVQQPLSKDWRIFLKSSPDLPKMNFASKYDK